MAVIGAFCAVAALVSCSSSNGWEIIHQTSLFDPNRTVAWPVIASSNFTQASSVEWEIVGVNNGQRKIAIWVEIGSSGCSTMRGVTVTETPSTVTIGAYVRDISLSAGPSDTRTVVSCSADMVAGIRTITLARPLASRVLLHAPITAD